MPTVSETLQALYALQLIDAQIQKTKKAQAALDNGTEAAAQAGAARDAAERQRGALHKLSGELKDRELKLETIETKRKSYQQKLYQGTVTNAKELANIEKEIEALGRQRSDLDSRVLELMEQVEQAQADLTVAEAKSHQAEGHLADLLSHYRSRYDALALELTALNSRREEARARVKDQALLKRYEELRQKAGGIGIARIDGSICGGCHMTLPSSLIKAVKDSAQPQTCENCGRLLIA